MFEYAPAAAGVEPGFAIVTGRFVTLFGHETGAEFAGELYALLEDDDAELADVLDLLALDGGPPDCGIVEVVDPDRRVVHVGVRGAVEVVMDGVASTRFSGPGGTAWVVGEASGIDGLRLRLGSGTATDGSGSRLPVQRGVVRAADIVLPRERTAPRRPRVDLSTRPIELPSRALLEAARQAPATAVAVATGVVAEAAGAGEAAVAPEPSVVVETSVAPEPSVVVETPVAPGPRRVDLAVAQPAWVMRLPDGSELRPPIVFGRRPRPADGGGVHVVTPSPRREISGRHVEVVEDASGLAALDLGSTNGTLVRTPGRAPRLLIHSGRMGLNPGDTLDLGESYLVTVGLSGEGSPTARIGSVSPG